MELKITCQCGQKLKFDVDPVDGRMPFQLDCPVCHRDATELANAELAVILTTPSVGLPSAEGVPPASTTNSGGLRINRARPEVMPAAVTPAEGDTPATPPPIRPRAPADVAESVKTKKSSFAKGLLGAFVGAVIGGVIYYLLFKYTGIRIKLFAIIVGGLAGWGAEFLGKGEGSKELGGIAAALTVGSVIGAQYLFALGLWHDSGLSNLVGSAYGRSVAEAKSVMRAMPDGTDAEIRLYLAKQESDDSGEAAKPASISADQIKDFREQQLPEYTALAHGTMTKAEYDAKHGIDSTQEQKEGESSDDTFKTFFALVFATRANFFSLLAAAALAYRLSANA